MKPETLEALLIDRSFGELSPEVEELLQTYLAADPTAAGRQAQFDATVRAAREAVVLKVEPSPTMRPFFRRDQAMWRTPWRLIARPEFLRLGAGIAAGVVLGWLVGRAPGTLAPDFAVARPVAMTRAAEKVPPATFWSVSRVLAESHERAAPRKYHDVAGGLPWRLPDR